MEKKSMEKHIFKFEFGGPQRWGGVESLQDERSWPGQLVYHTSFRSRTLARLRIVYSEGSK